MGDGEVAVVGHSDDGRAQQQEKRISQGGEHRDEADVRVGDGEDVTEEVGREIVHKARREVGKENTHRHTESPEQGYGAVLAHIAAAQEVDGEAREEGEDSGPHQGIDAQPCSESHSAQSSVGHAASRNHQAAGDHVRSDDGTEQCGPEAAPQRVLKKSIGENHDG